MILQANLSVEVTMETFDFGGYKSKATMETYLAWLL
jgi:hypothetical protein